MENEIQKIRRLEGKKVSLLNKVNSEWRVVNSSYRAPLAHLYGLSWIFSTLREFRLLSYAQSAQSRRYPAQVPSKNPPLTTHHSLLTNKKTAFTLAEVLITLGIIGVVAAITMPALIQKHREQVVTTKLKKFYSTFSQAYQMAVTENGTLEYWGLTNSQLIEDENGNENHSDESYANYEKFFNIMGKYMKIIKYERIPNGNISCYLSDGSEIVAMWLGAANCAGNASCGDFYVRVHGKHSDDSDVSNKDNVFSFIIYPNKIVPRGLYAEFDKCKNHSNLSRCTAWVLYNGNMDYLHCPDELSWDGKTKCR